MNDQLAKALCHQLDAELVETHISWLILGESVVLKLKKPVDLGFLDFTALEQRRFCCEEELRLNQRTAPDLYDAVVPISGSPQAPIIDDESDPIEYAVRMRRFDDSRLLDRLARDGELGSAVIDSLASTIAAFHQRVRYPQPPPQDFGSPNRVFAPAEENFDDLDRLDHRSADREMIDEIREWTTDTFTLRRADFVSRRESGYVRECHGDLHLGNLFEQDGNAVAFDCIEFNASLRWIDVAADIGFTVMDLINHDLPALANRLLNEYLSNTGDYGALRVLDWYLVYRAMVRAKVATIRSAQDDKASDSQSDVCTHYLELARGLTTARPAGLVLMCGLSGTGKTTQARPLAAELGAVHLRSDVERKRLYGLGLTDSSRDSALDIYTQAASERTFSRLEELAALAIECSRPVVVDATFIEHGLRHRFSSLADRLGVPWVIAECIASESAVRERLGARRGDASEAGFNQYLDQRARFDAFTGAEQERLVKIDTEASSRGIPEKVRTALGWADS